MTNSVKFSDYGQLRDIDCTDGEYEIFELLRQLSGEDLELVRRSNDYVTALLGEWDLARIKYTARAKWIVLPVIDRGSTKRRITSVEDVRQHEEDLAKSIEHIKKYQ